MSDVDEKKCPKCGKKGDDPGRCNHCGIIFNEYETAKQEKLIEVRVLLSEGKFEEAREVAENLPAEFPDNRTEFLLLLSNINRDISVRDKYEQAREAHESGDHEQAAMLLRNIKAFDPTLSEKVISLRRRTQQHLENEERFARAQEAFKSGNFAEAVSLFKKIRGFARQDEVSEYLDRIADLAGAMLEECLELVRNKRFSIALEKFAALRATFPDLREQVDGFITLLNKRLEIRNDLYNAARTASKEKRYLEAKALCILLEQRYPEFASQAAALARELEGGPPISLAEVETGIPIDLTALGLVDGGDGNDAGVSPADCREYVAPDDFTPDCFGEECDDPVAALGNRESSPDTLPPVPEVDTEGVADFAL
ncbi:MAG: hypothetical protein Kow0089_10090 [Desulfobulbaceae bacterium]